MGRDDSNLEPHYHGLVLVVRWHWGALGIDAEREISPEDEAAIKALARDGKGRAAAQKLANALGIKAPGEALDRLAQQLVRWAT